MLSTEQPMYTQLPASILSPEGTFALTQRQPTCSICLAGFQPHQTVTTLQCAHTFHFDCASRWFSDNNNCPICQLPCVDLTPAGYERAVCRDCHQKFLRPATADPYSMQYYRCRGCQSDFLPTAIINSCSVL
eukprot:TRINITY_DN9765_c0_g1::TRINITY_DN9765_c0_g1_i1::g.4859::m.4859 TRINITY_DN9765_c0_g1::TRINITY_DN9765_c0_g1_i1::g.4859  ORF type:complete len:132 (+),score=-6.95,sp/Q9Y252/RNF6_HUMAN/40.91/2e-07,zf-RING_2/PF13639.1/2.1e-13,zf-RING_2/PF13639.1/1.3e+03,zf-C3HC4_2/PF13923.1/2.7e-09,zf-C3HC4_2/PF13923.1/91,zf-C3HC4_2/PF13923.1/4e+02,zf-rbx1/PF12678.2/8.8e-09,zf-rbx1/PF12678.2/3e+03,zf-C3HC4_3/PF13920.1/8.6e-08,zf-C3HC4_3/PF13920.1/30,zf-C3HC4/PF00097.20/2.8e-07,zf-C3HC4/PF00097.20/3.3e+02,zf-RING_5/PF1